VSEMIDLCLFPPVVTTGTVAPPLLFMWGTDKLLQKIIPL
jgi:hypothetical protein